jgi:hypothetical protein
MGAHHGDQTRTPDRRTGRQRQKSRHVDATGPSVRGVRMPVTEIAQTCVDRLQARNGVGCNASGYQETVLGPFGRGNLHGVGDPRPFVGNHAD